ncbi:MAG: 30S ribosomal protein S2 [Chthoniobacterales bacterium]|nr:30S ribosomal protein S2 [Chthoniobacterales bacterium]
MTHSPSQQNSEISPSETERLTYLLEAGVHYGHQTRRWNPKMRQYILEERNSIYIINVEHTLRQLDEACSFLSNLIKNGGQILFVGTKKQAQDAVRQAAEITGQFYVNERWLGGTLTNLQTIRRSVSRLEHLESIENSSERLKTMTKQEAAALRREANRLRSNLAGIRNMQRLPDALIVIDTAHEQIAIHEANRLGIPVIGVVDTNADPDLVSYPIAANDDAIRSIRVILQHLVDAIVSAQNSLKSQKQASSNSAQTLTAVAE